MKMLTVVHAALLAGAAYSAPIIGGQGSFKYQYMPELLQFPQGASPVNCHGLARDLANNIYLTYDNGGGKDKNCLVRWSPDGTAGEFMTAGGDKLCHGTAHGLKIAEEGGKLFLYHANNADKLTKTTLDGEIVWQVEGNFGQPKNARYRPTWFGIPKDSPYVWLADGYGSCNVYVFTIEGKFTNVTYGGRGGRDEHGKFSTNHGITWDTRTDQLVISDRENHRLEVFDIDVNSAAKFAYNSTIDMINMVQVGENGGPARPCNIRTYPKQEGRAIVADLTGPVRILDNANKLISTVNVTGLLGGWHKVGVPHDAMFLENGDFVCANWMQGDGKQGKISYWKKL